MCIDYTDLNKVCLKDSFPLPWIDQLVYSVLGHKVLSFLDAYIGFNQILMHSDDVKKTAFITLHGMYYYKVISFRLKNTGVNFQRIMT